MTTHTLSPLSLHFSLIATLVILSAGCTAAPTNAYASSALASSYSMPVSSGLLSAKGYGTDKDVAKQNALAALSQQILSDVSSNVSQSTTVIGDNVIKTANVTRSLSSHLLLKGIRYQSVSPLGGELGFLAVMDSASAKQTVVFLQNETQFTPAGLKLSDIAPLNEKVTMLNAILTSLPKQAFSKQVTHQQQAKQKAKWIDQRQTQALWVLNLQKQPGLVSVDGAVVDLTKPLFLLAGRHDYKISLKGYRTQAGILTLHAGQLVVQTIDWIKADALIETGLVFGPNVAFMDRNEWQQILLPLGLSLGSFKKASGVHHSGIVLNVSSQGHSNKVDEFEMHFMTLSLSFYRGAERLKRIRLKLKANSYVGKIEPVHQAIRKGINKALPVLVSKTTLR